MKKVAVCGYTERIVKMCESYGVFRQFEVPFFYDRRAESMRAESVAVKTYEQTLDALGKGEIEAVVIPESRHISTQREILCAFLGRADIYVLTLMGQIVKFPDKSDKIRTDLRGIGLFVTDCAARDYFARLIEYFYGDIVKYYITSDFGGIDGVKTIGFEGLGSVAADLDGVVVPDQDYVGLPIEQNIRRCREHGAKEIFLPDANWRIKKSIALSEADIQGLLTLSRQDKYLGKLDIQMVDHCNLNCQGCSHFCPTVKKEWFYDPDDFASDITRTAEIFGEHFDHIAFLGGEPLLHPQLPDFIEITRRLFPYTHLVLITNGILLNSLAEETLSLLKEHDVSVIATVYPGVSGYERSKLRLRDHGIAHRYNRIDKFIAFIDMDGNADNYDVCPDKYCHTLRDGVISNCYIPLLSHYFNEFFGLDLPTFRSDQVLDVGSEISYEEACQVLLKPNDFCGYCRYLNGKFSKHRYVGIGQTPELSCWVL